MTWVDLEQCVNRALGCSFSKKKWMLAFLCLSLCGILMVFCRALAFGANEWIALSLIFLPALLSFGILLSLGVLLVRMYMHEAKHLSLSIRRLFTGSTDLMFSTMYLSLPPVFIYLILWIVLGFFYLLKEIPGIGDFFSIVFSFAPFLLILSALVLCAFNLGLLFFAVPAIALQPFKRLKMARAIRQMMRGQAFTAFILFSIGLIPIACTAVLLFIAAILTNVTFLIGAQSLSIALEWFFIMVPFCALLAPAVVFFFNFSAEACGLLQRRLQTSPLR